MHPQTSDGPLPDIRHLVRSHPPEVLDNSDVVFHLSLRASAADGHVHAFGGEPERDRAADAAASTSHQADLSLQLEIHRAKLAEYEELRAGAGGAEARGGPLVALDAGIAHEREWVRYWKRLAESG